MKLDHTAHAVCTYARRACPVHAQPNSQARANARCVAQVNEVGFSFTAFRMIRGAFTVEATFEPVSPQRVAIRFARATLVPEQLQKLFEVPPATLQGLPSFARTRS